MGKIDQSRIDSALDFIFDLMLNQGHSEYHGEPVSVLEHSIQTAEIAQKAKAKNYTIIAAFLHDIGHLMVESSADEMDGFGHISHEKIGANKLLELGFSEKIVELVLNHVHTKRYLVTKFPAYFEKLSEASIETLKMQGGKMDKTEMIAFELKSQFKNSLLLRIWDDKAKIPNQHIPDLCYYYDLIKAHLIAIQKLKAKSLNLKL